MTKYLNTDSDLVSSGGGSVRVVINSMHVGQGNGGTSLPCREVSLRQYSDNFGTARVNIGSTCSATNGIPLAEGGAANSLKIKIDDVSKLYFYSDGPGDYIDILYRY